MPALISWWTMDVDELAPEAHNDTVAMVGQDLLRRWSEPQRRYHTTAHLVEMFWALEELEEAGEIKDADPALARVAAWFHDAVYDPTALHGINEHESSRLARELLTSLSFSAEHLDAVRRLVDLTVDHEAVAEEPLDLAFQDADLWVLSAPEARFEEYCEQVRAEFAHVPEEDYRRARCAILEPLLRRDTIYRTGHAVGAWEGHARVNLGRELARLRD